MFNLHVLYACIYTVRVPYRRISFCHFRPYRGFHQIHLLRTHFTGQLYNVFISDFNISIIYPDCRFKTGHRWYSNSCFPFSFTVFVSIVSTLFYTMFVLNFSVLLCYSFLYFYINNQLVYGIAL